MKYCILCTFFCLQTLFNHLCIHGFNKETWDTSAEAGNAKNQRSLRWGTESLAREIGNGWKYLLHRVWWAVLGQGPKQRREGVLTSWDVPESFLEEGALELNLEDQAAFEHIHMSPFWISTHSCHMLTRYVATGKMTFYRTQVV